MNGRYEFVGSQRNTLAETVAEAAQAPRATVNLARAAVVRSLRVLGAVGADGTFSGSAPLNLNSGWKISHLRAVVLMQENASHHIVGAASLALGSKLTALN